jgi:hypothetical protein
MTAAGRPGYSLVVGWFPGVTKTEWRELFVFLGEVIIDLLAAW